MDIALGIWNDLKIRFSQGDLSRIYDLQLEVASLKQGDLYVTERFTKLIIIWDELENFNLILYVSMQLSVRLLFPLLLIKENVRIRLCSSYIV